MSEEDVIEVFHANKMSKVKLRQLYKMIRDKLNETDEETENIVIGMIQSGKLEFDVSSGEVRLP